MGMLPRALPGYGLGSHNERVTLLDERRERARAALDSMAHGALPEDVGAKRLSQMDVCRRRRPPRAASPHPLHSV